MIGSIRRSALAVYVHRHLSEGLPCRSLEALGEITAEAEHAPSYYRGMEVDFWFRLWDVRRLVADDTPGVIEELHRLGNTRYQGRPVSLHGGMVELPLIVTRDDGCRSPELPSLLNLFGRIP